MCVGALYVYLCFSICAFACSYVCIYFFFVCVRICNKNKSG